ncbi:MAG: NAD-dependent epimerase/dehydratase family protein [Planctomycetota bacterium]
MKFLITGGAGFIGCNAAARLQDRGETVVVLDNLARKGSSDNLTWLRKRGRIVFEKADIRNAPLVQKIFTRHADVKAVIHVAAQTAVTTSVENPREDFEINALGTLNVLEAVRTHTPHAAFLYSSTNKVYGGMKNAGTQLSAGRYQYRDFPRGISERYPLDFHSPYGCSKGAADQYTRDYARIYALKTVVLRQSCIYGPRQFGNEDQGWIGWFTIAAALNKSVVLYGNGRQVRDALYIDDLINLFLRCVDRIERVRGHVYNVGGGPKNTLSLLELVHDLNTLTGRRLRLKISGWRPGDQRCFISDISSVSRDLSWKPTVGIHEGVKRLHRWVVENAPLLKNLLSTR